MKNKVIILTSKQINFLRLTYLLKWVDDEELLKFRHNCEFDFNQSDYDNLTVAFEYLSDFELNFKVIMSLLIKNDKNQLNNLVDNLANLYQKGKIVEAFSISDKFIKEYNNITQLISNKLILKHKLFSERLYVLFNLTNNR